MRIFNTSSLIQVCLKFLRKLWASDETLIELAPRFPRTICVCVCVGVGVRVHVRMGVCEKECVWMFTLWMSA